MGLTQLPIPRAGALKDFKSARRTSGDISLTSTTWANVDTGLDLALAAAAGDIIEVNLSARVSADQVDLDCATIVSGAVVNSFAANGAENPSNLGITSWSYYSAGTDDGTGGAFMYTLQAGDIAAGTVTLRLRYKVSAATKTLYASTNNVLQFTAKNLGQVGGWAAQSGTSVWDATLTLDTSLTGWTSVVGTWASNGGGYIEQTNNAVVEGLLRRTVNAGKGGAFIIEAEVRFPTSGQGAGSIYGGFGLLNEISAANGFIARLSRQSGVWKVETQLSQVAANAARNFNGVTGALDSWFKLRVSLIGNVATVWIDNVYQMTVGMGGLNGSIDHLHLWAYTGVVHYRNIKLWTLTGLPA